MKPLLYTVLSRQCNLSCAHCYMSAGPRLKNTTISQEDFASVIAHVPKISTYMHLSGGEVFSFKKEFYGFLETIQKENARRARRHQHPIEVGVQTNGFWAKTHEKTRATLEELLAFGVSELDITSNDSFHEDEGINRSHIYNLKREAETMQGFSDISLRGSTKSRVFPLGRGKNVARRKKFDYREDCKKSLFDYDLTIHPDGSVYPCCFGIHPLEGNMIEEPLTRIVARAKRDGRMRALDLRGIRGIARQDGHTAQEVREGVNHYGPCGFCVQHYGT